MGQGRTIVYCFLLSIALGFSGWYYVRKEHQQLWVGLPKNTSDYYAKQVEYTLFDQHGRVSRRYASDFIKHYPKANTSIFQKPHIEIYQENSPPWLITADHGNALGGDKSITLWKNVRIQQAGSAKHAPTLITTEKIHFYPKKHFASTDEWITYKQPGSSIQSKGMRANLKNQRIELISNARGHYVHAPRS